MEIGDLIIDEELHNLIPPLTVEEYNQLEQNIVEDGEVRDPIIVWEGTNIIVDGHNRYSILMDHPDIPYKIAEKPFESREDVIAWMCANQLGRRNITEVQRTILLGKAYEAKKVSYSQKVVRDEHGLFVGSGEAGPKEQIANKYNVSTQEVERSGRYVRGLNEIEAKFPGTTKKIQTGDLEVVKKDVMAITTLDGEDKEEAIQDIVSGKRIKRNIVEPEKKEEPRASYTIEDFHSELVRKVQGMDKSLELTCVLTHKSCLESEEGKEALRDALLKLTEVVKKYFAMCE